MTGLANILHTLTVHETNSWIFSASLYPFHLWPGSGFYWGRRGSKCPVEACQATIRAQRQCQKLGLLTLFLLQPEQCWLIPWCTLLGPRKISLEQKVPSAQRKRERRQKEERKGGRKGRKRKNENHWIKYCTSFLTGLPASSLHPSNLPFDVACWIVVYAIMCCKHFKTETLHEYGFIINSPNNKKVYDHGEVCQGGQIHGNKWKLDF